LLTAAAADGGGGDDVFATAVNNNDRMVANRLLLPPPSLLLLMLPPPRLSVVQICQPPCRAVIDIDDNCYRRRQRLPSPLPQLTTTTAKSQ
jgi:hypothetical protein